MMTTLNRIADQIADWLMTKNQLIALAGMTLLCAFMLPFIFLGKVPKEDEESLRGAAVMGIIGWLIISIFIYLMYWIIR